MKCINCSNELNRNDYCVCTQCRRQICPECAERNSFVCPECGGDLAYLS